MPFRAGEMGGDADYFALYKQRDAIVPYLVDALDDDTPMADPSDAPKLQDFRVGDLAMLMLMDFEVVEYAQCAPPRVMRQVESVGAQAFFDWVHDCHRNALRRCVAGIAKTRLE